MAEQEEERETQNQDRAQESLEREEEVEELSHLISEDYREKMEAPPFRKHERS